MSRPIATSERREWAMKLTSDFARRDPGDRLAPNGPRGLIWARVAVDWVGDQTADHLEPILRNGSGGGRGTA